MPEAGSRKPLPPAKVQPVEEPSPPQEPVSPVVAALLPHLASDPARLVLEVAPEDEMLLAGVEAFGRREIALVEYFLTGWIVSRLWLRTLEARFPSLDGLSILDFGSGWGRVTRYLAAELPGARIAVADLMSDAVSFQERAFGVEAFPLPKDPVNAGDERRFDAIFATSVFTHLPRQAFVDWMGWLLARLAPGGILAFTTNRPDVLPGALQEDCETPFAFGPDSENRRLDATSYGTTWVRESFVRGTVESLRPEAVTLVFPRRVRHFQDLYVVATPPADASSLRALERDEPQVMLEAAEIMDSGRLGACGWIAVGPTTPPPRRIEVWCAAERLAETSPGPERFDLSAALGVAGLRGWSWSLEVPAGEGGTLGQRPLVLLVVDHDGARWPVLAGRPADWIRQPSELARVEATRRAEFFTRRFEEVASALELSGWERFKLERRIEAMESSRFWRLRRIWFRVKRALGLPAVE